MAMDRKIYTSLSEEDTTQLGIELASRLRPGDLVAMYGDLGTGKTEFVRGICSGLDVADLISSPTFTIINEYTGELADGRETTIYHIDLYRLESDRDLEEIGLPDILADDLAVKLVEWSEHADSLLPERRIEVRLTQLEEEENGRTIVVVFPDPMPVLDEKGGGDESA